MVSFRTNPKLLESQRWKGLKIGIFGGSFNPPHQAHVHLCLTALKSLKLDAIWWIVSASHPLKRPNDILPFGDRISLSKKLAFHPKIIVSDLEQQTKTHRSLLTLRILKKYFPHSSFIYLGGFDLAAEMPKWYRAKTLIQETPFAFFHRRSDEFSPCQSLYPRRLGVAQKTLLRGQGSGHWTHQKNGVYWLRQGACLPHASRKIRASQTENLPESSKTDILKV
jgi:nicotinate-nucleotide adenylyltransferase